MPGQKPSAHDFAGWLAGRWRTLLIMLLLACVLGPGIAVFCLVAGVRGEVIRSTSSKVAQQIGLSATLAALIAAGLPAVVYGCTVWGWQIVGYSWGVAEGEAAAPSLFRAASPPVSLSEQMLRPFRRRRP